MDDLDARVRRVEIELALADLRMTALEGWRRFDEPRVAELVTNDNVADEVRKALRGRTVHEWTILQKGGALLAGAAVLAGSVAQLIQAVHG